MQQGEEYCRKFEDILKSKTANDFKKQRNKG